jgi:hypothetical protein
MDGETRDGKDDRYPWLIIADLPYSQGDDISGKHQDRSAFFSGDWAINRTAQTGPTKK